MLVLGCVCLYDMQLSRAAIGSYGWVTQNPEMIGKTSFLVLVLGGCQLGSPVHPRARSCSDFPLEGQLSWKIWLGHIPMSGSESCQAWLLLFSPTPLQQGARHLGHPWGELLRSRLSMAGSHGAACMWESGCGWGWDCWSPVLTGLQAELHAHPPPTHSGKEGALHTLV